MRSDSTATWTSGDPVSPSLVWYCATSSFLRSAVIVIVGHRSLEVEYEEWPKLAFRELGQRNRLALLCGEKNREPLKVGAVGLAFRDPRELRRTDQDRIAALQAGRICRRYGQRRDAVQRGRKGLQVLQSGVNMHR